MSSESPAVIIYSSDGYETAVINGNATPANTRGTMSAGSDGTNSRFVTVDTSGRQIVAGAGVAGTATGGVITIQGIAGGVTVPISGTVTAANASVSATGAAVPGSATLIGGSVTTAAPGYTTGQMSGLSLNLAGGLRVDGSGVTQPVSGSVTVAQPTAASLNATVVQATAANLNATVIGTVTANIGTSGSLALDTSVNGLLVSQASATSGEKGPLVMGATTTGSPTYTTAQTNPISLTTAGAVRTDASATVQPISGSVSIIGNVSTISGKSSVGTITSAVSSITSVTLLASNANRLGAAFFNDSTAILYLALTSSAASLTAFTIKILPGSSYELSAALYTGIITGIWNAANGNCRVTELS